MALSDAESKVRSDYLLTNVDLAAHVESGNIDAPEGSREWSIAMALVLRRLVRRNVLDMHSIESCYTRFKQHRGWEHVKRTNGRPFRHLDEFCADRSIGLGISRSKLEAKIEKWREQGPLAAHGEIGRGRDRGDYGTSTKRGSNAASYLARRLLRDAPKVFERLEAGDFKSVRQAAIAAGIVKEPTPLDELKRGWKKASDEERRTFLEWTAPPEPRPTSAPGPRGQPASS